MVCRGAMDGKERRYSGRMVCRGAMDGKERRVFAVLQKQFKKACLVQAFLLCSGWNSVINYSINQP